MRQMVSGHLDRDRVICEDAGVKTRDESRHLGLG